MVSLPLVGWCGCDPHSRREATPAYKWGDWTKENEVPNWCYNDLRLGGDRNEIREYLLEWVEERAESMVTA